jgi:F-type H+-transporting ATPase subunit epsilon
MENTFYLQIATPDKDFYNGVVQAVRLTTTDGELGVLAGHSAMAVALAPAPLCIQTAEGWREAAVIGGFASIRPAYMIIFADTAEWPEDIEEARALEAKHRAEEHLHAKQNKDEYLRAHLALQRATTRLAVRRHKFK